MLKQEFKLPTTWALWGLNPEVAALHLWVPALLQVVMSGRALPQGPAVIPVLSPTAMEGS